MVKPFQLGRGLGSLIPGRATTPESAPVQPPVAPGTVRNIALSSIEPNPHQPRKQFEAEALNELAASIKQHGLLQPLVVEPTSDGRYRLIVGERRWRAAKLAGLTEVPAIVREISQQERLELALVENIQRQNLNPLEEAAAYRRLQDEFGLTQEAVAKRVGKSRSQVANTERLLTLPAVIQEALRDGRITVGHAKVILSLPTGPEQEKFFASVVQQGLPVHLLELKAQGVRVKAHERKKSGGSPELRALEQQLQGLLGTKVRIRGTPQRGVVEVVFYSSEELRELMRRMSG